MEASAHGGAYPEKKGGEKAKLISTVGILFRLGINHEFWYCQYLGHHLS